MTAGVPDEIGCRWSGIATVCLLLLGCSPDPVTRGAGERTPLGKGDNPAGSCESRCGGQGSGRCFCDDLCERNGDCCADFAATCASSSLTACFPGSVGSPLQISPAWETVAEDADIATSGSEVVVSWLAYSGIAYTDGTKYGRPSARRLTLADLAEEDSWSWNHFIDSGRSASLRTAEIAGDFVFAYNNLYPGDAGAAVQSYRGCHLRAGANRTTVMNFCHAPELVSTGDGLGLVTNYGGLTLLRCSAQGKPVPGGAQTRISSLPPYAWAAAWNPARGTYLIVYHSYSSSTTGGQLYAAEVTKGGHVVFNDRPLNLELFTVDSTLPITTQDLLGRGAKIALARGAQDFGLLWTSPTGLRYARLSDDAAAIGGPVLLSEGGWQGRIAWSGSGFGALWTEGTPPDTDVVFASIDEDGTMMGALVPVAQGPSRSWQPALAYAGGRFLAAWADDAVGVGTSAVLLAPVCPAQ